MQNIDAILKRSVEQEKAQQYNEALLTVQEARQKNPQDRRLAIRQGQMLEVTKQLPQALILYRQLTEAQPESQEAELVIGLARCLLASSQYEQAGKLFGDLHTRLPKDPDVLVGLAGYRRHKGALNDAEKLTNQALQVKPGFKPAVYELAEIQIANKEQDQAVVTLERNVLRADLHGDSLDLWLKVLHDQNRDRYAQETMEEACRKYPNKVEFFFAVGVLAHRAGEISIARPALAKSDELSPNNYRILYEWGVMERVAGDIEHSQTLISKALDLHPEQPAALRTFGNDYTYTYGDPVFTRLNFVAARLADLEAVEQVHMHYALAKAFEDVGELDTGYRHYEIGGVKKKKLQPYSERDASRLFQVLPGAVNAHTRTLAPQEGCPSELPVFILGMPRSGTSLMEQILSSHKDVYGAGELKYLTGIVDNIQFGMNRINLNDAEAVFPYDDNISWEMRGQRYVDKLEKLAPKTYLRIVDKMPGNFTLVGLINAILPNAKIIHSRRHPVETCLSCYRIHFAEGQHWSYNLRELGRYYKRYWNLMKHWRAEFPGVMHEVRYEDNVADVEGQARKLIDYLGLEWDNNCLNFYNTDRPVKTASLSQVRKPIYTTSTNRWRKYEKYLGPLLEELGDLVPEYEAEIAHLNAKD